jgi:hypothetical protein
MNQFEPISGKKLRVLLGSFIQTPQYFLETEDNIFKTCYKYYTLNILESIQINVFNILIIKKYSSYGRISKSQTNQPFIKYNSTNLQK